MIIKNDIKNQMTLLLPEAFLDISARTQGRIFIVKKEIKSTSKNDKFIKYPFLLNYLIENTAAI